MFLANQSPPSIAVVRHEHIQRKACPLVLQALLATSALVWILAGAARLACAESAPASALQKALWDERALPGSDADKTALTTRHGACPDGQPDCRQGPALTGETRALLPEASALPGSIRSVVPRDGQKLIALTFDLCEMAGERAGYDANIVNYLRQHGVKATFYAGGKWMRSHPEKTLQFGTCTAENLHLLEKLKLPAVQWSIVTGDPSPGQGAAAIASAVLSQAKPGAIVIAHANGKGWHTAEALPLFIPPLQQQGYRFVTVGELLRSASQVETSNLCYELKPGDNARYDRLGR